MRTWHYWQEAAYSIVIEGYSFFVLQLLDGRI